MLGPNDQQLTEDLDVPPIGGLVGCRSDCDRLWWAARVSTDFASAVDNRCHHFADNTDNGFSDDQARRVYPRVVITVPDGWANVDGWGINARSETPRWTAVTFWDVNEVYAHPCGWRGEPLIDPGRTVDGLVEALVDRPMRNATTPVEVSVDGYEGYMLEWSVPTDIDFTSCDEGYFESWTGLGWSSDRCQQGPGQVDRLWILDVNGSRLVIDAMYMPGATEQDREELFAVVDSIHFQPVTERVNVGEDGRKDITDPGTRVPCRGSRVPNLTSVPHQDTPRRAHNPTSLGRVVECLNLTWA